MTSRRANLALVCFVAALLAATAVLADRAPLSNDELFTYYVSDLPGPGDIWSELETGVEQTPFSFYLVTKAAMVVFGESALAMRLPEVLGFALMAVCLFQLVARRSSALYGFVAVLLVVASTAYDHSYEARAYALVLGFAASAFLCWQIAAEGGPRRRIAALGLALSLAAAVGSHYYAVLLLIPLAVGEAARSFRRGRIDWLVVGAFSGALLPLIVFAPLIGASQDYSTTFWARPTWIASVRFHLNLLSERWLWILVGTILVSAFAVARRARPGAHRLPAPEHELVALGTLVLLPAFGVLAGQTLTGAFTGRYTLAAAIGVAALVALAARWVDRAAPVAGVTLLILFAVLAGVRYVDRHGTATRDTKQQTGALDFLARYDNGDLPLAVSSPHEFFVLSHRSAEDGGPRLVYLASPGLSLDYLGTDAVDLGVEGMKRIAPLHVESYRDFVADTPRFLLYGSRGAWTWVTEALRSDGARLRVVARNPADGEALFEVRR